MRLISGMIPILSATSILVFKTNPPLQLRDILLYPIPLERSQVVEFGVISFFSGAGEISVNLSDDDTPFYNIYYIKMNFIAGQLQHYRFTLPPYTIIQKSRMTFAMWQDIAVKEFRSNTITVFPQNRETINLNSFSAYFPSGLVAKVNDVGDIGYIREAFYFKNFSKEKSEPIYYSFPLDEFWFSSDSPDIYNEDITGELMIKDPEQLFLYLPHDDEDYFHLSLRIWNNGQSLFTLSLDNGYYFNPITNEMAINRLNGFERTDTLYFPVNTFVNGINFAFQLHLYDLGFNNDDARLAGIISFGQPLIGRSDTALISIITRPGDLDPAGENMQEVNLDV